MGNRKAREFMLRHDEEMEWEKTRTKERLASEDVHARGIGHRRIQLIRCPSFEEGFAWEIRESTEWKAYRSKVVIESGSEYRLVGYDLVLADPAVLKTFFDRLCILSVPLRPIGGMAGADGTSYQVAVFDLFCSWRAQWWEEPPPQWKAVGEVVDQILELFACSNVQS